MFVMLDWVFLIFQIFADCKLLYSLILLPQLCFQLQW